MSCLSEAEAKSDLRQFQPMRDALHASVQPVNAVGHMSILTFKNTQSPFDLADIFANGIHCASDVNQLTNGSTGNDGHAMTL